MKANLDRIQLYFYMPHQTMAVERTNIFYLDINIFLRSIHVGKALHLTCVGLLLVLNML